MTLLEPTTRLQRPRRVGVLWGYALFHLNLMFSSIEEEQRPDVIARCYEPLLDLADQGFPIAIEATGLTLEIIETLAPHWNRRLKQLIAKCQVEFVGSGYAQAIGPLMPWRVVAKNFELGLEVYDRLLGVRPTVALVNEQAYSAGLVELYREAGYTAIITDWDDASSHHPEWNRHWRYHPQIAVGTNGAEIALLWSNTIAFQKLQRFVHGDIDLEAYVDYLTTQRTSVDRCIAIYSNDAECFGFRPGRFVTEEIVGSDEWQKVAAALAGLKDVGIRLALPSDLLKDTNSANAGQGLTLEAPNNPVPVKKQPKYNLTRWASSGRDDLWANALCHRAASLLTDAPSQADDWRSLCRLWSSDFRTHITASRWSRFTADLEAFVARLEAGAPPPIAAAPQAHASASIERGERIILVETPLLRVAFDTRRGLAVAAMGRPNERPLIGGLAHGEIDDITLSADWYTGSMVFEAPAEPKVTDLERCTPTIDIDPTTGDVRLQATIATPHGPVHKTITVSCTEPAITTDVTFDWAVWGKGSLRLGHVTLLPDAFNAATLAYTTHNGGRTPERFALSGQTVDLGAPVSLLISSRAGIGMTEGWLQVDDGNNGVRLEADLAMAAVLGLVEHKTAHGRLFCRLMLSAMELDETRKPEPHRHNRRVRYTTRLLKVDPGGFC